MLPVNNNFLLNDIEERLSFCEDRKGEMVTNFRTPFDRSIEEIKTPFHALADQFRHELHPDTEDYKRLASRVQEFVNRCDHDSPDSLYINQLFQALKEKITDLDTILSQMPDYLNVIERIQTCAARFDALRDYKYNKDPDTLCENSKRILDLHTEASKIMTTLSSSSLSLDLVRPLMIHAKAIKEKTAEKYNTISVAHFQHLLEHLRYLSQLSPEAQEENVANLAFLDEQLPQPWLDAIHYEIWASTTPRPENDPDFGKREMWKDIPRLCSVLEKLIGQTTSQQGYVEHFDTDSEDGVQLTVDRDLFPNLFDDRGRIIPRSQLPPFQANHDRDPFSNSLFSLPPRFPINDDRGLSSRSLFPPFQIQYSPLEKAHSAIRQYAAEQYLHLREDDKDSLKERNDKANKILEGLDQDTRNAIYKKVWEQRKDSEELASLDPTDSQFGKNNVGADLNLLGQIVSEMRWDDQSSATDSESEEDYPTIRRANSFSLPISTTSSLFQQPTLTNVFVAVECDAGWGNCLEIRGEGIDGLDWEEGLPMECDSTGAFWTIPCSSVDLANAKFKIVKVRADGTGKAIWENLEGNHSFNSVRNGMLTIKPDFNQKPSSAST